MPRYKVRVEGTNIELATKNGAPIVGFFVTRLIEAESVDRARAQAIAVVERDWATGTYAPLKQAPALSVIEIGEAGWLDRVTANTAYIFHRGK